MRRIFAMFELGESTLKHSINVESTCLHDQTKHCVIMLSVLPCAILLDAL